MNSKKELIKTGIGIIVGVGVSTIAGSAIGIIRPRNIGKIKNLCVGLGAIVLSSMLSDQATKYTEDKIDEAVDVVQDMFGKKGDEENEEVESEETTEES